MPLKPRAVLAARDGGKAPLIEIVAPASSAQDARLDGGYASLTARGFEVRFAEHARGRSAPYFSATAEQRLADLHDAFADEAVSAIMCTRGGYGSNYLLEGLELDLIRAHPKPFFGYSDMTALQTWLIDQTGLVAFHGPMLAADFHLEDGVDERSFRGALSGELLSYGVDEGLRVLRPGRAEGTLYGGCLTLLTASLGTPYAPQTEGKLLFLEDVGTKPYQVDRMLRHLRLAGKLDGVTGLIFGEMLDCVSPGAHPRLLEQAIVSALDWGVPGGFSGPIAIGLRSGHVSRANVTLPLNILAELNLDDEERPLLRTLEPAVEI